MDFAYSDEQKALRESTIRFARGALNEHQSNLLMARIDRALDRGDFAVSVLGADAAEVSATVGGRDPDKFSRVPLDRTGRGLPVVSGSLAWFDCSVARVVDGGDHVVILADVHGAGPADRDGDPLLFFRGRYEQIARPAPTVTPEITRPVTPSVTPSVAPDLAAVGSARHRELAGALTGYTPGDWF